MLGNTQNVVRKQSQCSFFDVPSLQNSLHKAAHEERQGCNWDPLRPCQCFAPPIPTCNSATIRCSACRQEGSGWGRVGPCVRGCQRRGVDRVQKLPEARIEVRSLMRHALISVQSRVLGHRADGHDSMGQVKRHWLRPATHLVVLAHLVLGTCSLGQLLG